MTDRRIVSQASSLRVGARASGAVGEITWSFRGRPFDFVSPTWCSPDLHLGLSGVRIAVWPPVSGFMRGIVNVYLPTGFFSVEADVLAGAGSIGARQIFDATTHQIQPHSILVPAIGFDVGGLTASVSLTVEFA